MDQTHSSPRVGATQAYVNNWDHAFARPQLERHSHNWDSNGYPRYNERSCPICARWRALVAEWDANNALDRR